MSGDGLVKGVLHVGVASGDGKRLLDLLAHLGFSVVSQETLIPEGAASTIVASGGAAIEILTPADESSAIASFLDRRGPGLHHLCLEVTDIEAAMALGREAGLEFIDATPRKDPDGLRVFVHPKSFNGILVGLVERR